MQLSTLQKTGLLAVAVIASLLFSPKWFSALGVWLYYPALLLLLRHGNWKWWVGSYLALLPPLVASQLGVIPLPFTEMVVFFSVGNAIGLLPFLLDRLASRKLPSWAALFVFPIAATALDVFFSNGPQGTWGNNAYTQVHFRPLLQVAAVTGIFGINFLYYWFATVVVNACEGRQWRRPQWAFTITFALVLLGGSVRLLQEPSGKEVAMAAIHVDNHAVYEAAYLATTGERISIG
ncbi:MAG: hypothetical protein AAF597_12380, partial [Bacteroidota bacterium]